MAPAASFRVIGSRAILVLLLGNPAWLGCGPQLPAAEVGVEHPLLGVGAPELDLAGPDGKARVRLEDHRGKVVLVDFWATWCEPCRQSFPAYQKLMDRSGGAFIVLGISVDEEPTQIAQFVSETGVRFPIAWDEGQVAAGAYAPPTMPTSFVIDENGIVRFVHTGYRSGDELKLEQRIQSLR